MMKTLTQKTELFVRITEKKFLKFSLIVLLILFSGKRGAKAESMVIDNLTGAITQNEIDNFKAYMASKVTPPAYSGGNVYVYGNAGKAIEACGLMYEATGDIEILDRMIYYSDACLAGRNDLASSSVGGQRLSWTGEIEPIWPSVDQSETVAGAGIEQGEVLSHMLYCAKLILQTPAIWNTTVPDGDPKVYGATYKQRALKYITEADYVMDAWILPRFLKASEDNHFYFPGAPNTYKPNDPAPWNQLFMLTDGFIRLIQCHELLNDNPARVTQFDAIVQSNLDWFYQNVSAQTSYTGAAINLWLYAIGGSIEDANHFAYEAQGLWIAYESKRYGLTFKSIVPFANTYVDMVLGIYNNTTNKYAGKVDGTTGSGNSGGDNYVRDEYIYLTEFRPDQYTRFATINNSKIASSPQITARLLWEKNRRYINSQTNLTQLPEQAVVVIPGHKNKRVLFGDVTLKWTGSINTASYKVYLGTSEANMQDLGTVTDATLDVPDLAANTKYFWRVDATNNVGTVTGEVYYFTTYDPNNLPPDPTGDQIRITGDGGKMTAQFSGSGSGAITVGNHIPNLVDVNTGTKFYISSKTALWFQYEPVAPVALSTYKISSGNDRPARDPKSWTVKGSNDGVNWILLDERSDEAFSAREQTNFYIVNDETKYKYFRLYITQNAGEANTQLSEWNIYQSKTLPVELVSFEAKKQVNGVDLSWRTASENNNSYFMIYKAGDDQRFQPLTKIAGKGNLNQLQTYSFTDKEPLKGNNYYKLVQFDFDGTATEKGVSVVNFNLAKPGLLVYPNPLVGSMINLYYDNEDTAFKVEIQDLAGRTVFEKELTTSNSQKRHHFNLNFKPDKGIYLLKVISVNNKMAVTKLLVE